MTIEFAWLFKLILSHLITDFILQPKSWIKDRYAKHFLSVKLYLHGFITAGLALILIGTHYWMVILAILFTHIVIDGWKSYRPDRIGYFLADQLFHLTVIFGCWYFEFFKWDDIVNYWNQIYFQADTWKDLMAILFLTTPSSILIGQFTKKWRDEITDSKSGESLDNAGKWIGIIERIIILIFVLQNQYEAIGLLIAAKGIIRFNEKNRPEIKTEYLVIGTLMSMGLAILTGLMLQL